MRGQGLGRRLEQTNKHITKDIFILTGKSVGLFGLVGFISLKAYHLFMGHLPAKFDTNNLHIIIWFQATIPIIINLHMVIYIYIYIYIYIPQPLSSGRI